ncbi:MAG: hypothetical protein QXV69_06830 [Sulfolobaceae archaeon]
MKPIPKIAVVGSYTIDYLESGEKVIGGIFYSTYGIWKAGGKAYAVTIIPNYIEINNPFVDNTIILDDNDVVKFRIVKVNNKRNIYLLNKVKKVLIDLKYLKEFDGILINTMYNEFLIENIFLVNCPIAVDIQGFVREVNNDNSLITNNYDKVKENMRKANQNLVVHGNEDELPSNVIYEMMYKYGFKEVIRSYGERGLEVFTRYYSKYFDVNKIGVHNIGNGDVLLGSYFTYRLMGYDVLSSIKMAINLVEDFSIHGPPVVLRISQY